MQQLRNVVGSIAGKVRDIVRRPDTPTATTGDVTRNYEDEREATRLGGMSEEDRAWEAARRDRSRAAEDAAEERGTSPPEHG